MAVIDTSMNMPKDCYMCFKYGCEKRKTGIDCCDGRPSDCPLKEVNTNAVLEDIKAEIQNIYVGYRQGYEIMADVLAVFDNHISGKEHQGENI